MRPPPGVAALFLVAAGLATPPTADGQDVAALLDAARAHLEHRHVDSAGTLLRLAADPTLRATPGQRALASVLGGVGDLIRGNPTTARLAFRDALALEPTIKVDSLATLHPDLLRVFGFARAGPVTLVVTLPRDTVVPLDSGVLWFGVRTSRRTPVTVAIHAPGRTTPVAVDSQHVTGTGLFAWRPGAAAVPPTPAGPPTAWFTLRVVAHDSAGDVAFATTLRVDRVGVDTQPQPPPPAAIELLPESTPPRARESRHLLVGLAFGGAAAMLATLGPQGDARAFVVGGAVSLGGAIAALRRSPTRRPLPQNMERNRAMLAAQVDAQDAVARANAQARAGASLRIVVTAGRP